MAYIVLEDSRGGVDRRRPIYALKPGTLWTCINAHITNGGEIEKRKAFVKQGVFGLGTFGLAVSGDALYTFGSAPAASVTVPSGVIYQRCQHPDGTAMTAVLDYDLFYGLIYVIARYADGMVLHFYNGQLVTEWSDGIVRAAIGDLPTMAATLAQYITVSPNYIAFPAGDTITVTAEVPGVPFTISTFATNGGTIDDQAMTSANVTANVAPVTAVAANFGFPVHGGPAVGTITSITIGGIEILGGVVNWTDDAAFAAAIATQINANVSVPDYTANSIGSTVNMFAAIAGTTPNGLTIAVTTTGTVTADGQTAAGTSNIGVMGGGVNTVVAVAQVNTITISGTFDVGDRFGVKMISGAANTTQIIEYFGNDAKPWGNATCVKTHKRKMYAGAGKILDFSSVNDATLWNVDIDPGAGFLIAANHLGGSESITSLETYMGRLAIFARKAIQLWTMQNDDTLNNPEQNIEHTGTRSPRSTLEFGGNDVLYLDDSGINSLRARDASNNAYATGVGASINKYVRDWMRTGVSEQDIVDAVSAIDPEEARFWMAIGTKIFVYSFYVAVGVAAWSWYEPGFKVMAFARTNNRIWCRGDDGGLYLYGGSSNAEYDASHVEVQFPFVTMQKPGTFKNWSGMDVATVGTWGCVWKTDPNNLDEPGVQMGQSTGVTFPKPGWPGVGHFTHVAPLLTNDVAEYASISQIALYFQGAEEAGP